MEEKYIYEYRCMAVTHEVVLILNRIVEELDDRYIIINEHGVQKMLFKSSIDNDYNNYYLERDDKKAIKAMFEKSEKNRAAYNNAKAKEISKVNRDFDDEQTSLEKVFSGEISISEKKHQGESKRILK